MPVRRGKLAVPGQQERSVLRWRLLGRYANDDEFTTELEAIFADHPGVGERASWSRLWLDVEFEAERPADYPGPPLDPVVVAYGYAVMRFVTRWGLDRLKGPPEDQGCWLIHDWYGVRLRWGKAVPPELFAGLLGIGSIEPDIGEVVSQREEIVGNIRFVDVEVRPLVHIAFIDEWDPRAEARKDARDRLLLRAQTEIQRELDRLTEDTEAKDYVFPVARREEERDLDWLFAMMTRRLTFEAIVELVGGDPFKAEVTAGQAIRRIADRVGVSTVGWRLTRS